MAHCAAKLGARSAIACAGLRRLCFSPFSMERMAVCRYRSDDERSQAAGSGEGAMQQSSAKKEQPTSGPAPVTGAGADKGFSLWWSVLPFAIGLTFFRGGHEIAWQSYLSALITHPIQAKLATGTVGALVGDFIAQVCPPLLAKVQGKTDAAPFKYQFARGFRFMCFSAFVGTPMALMWYGLLDTMVLPTDPTCAQAVLTKVVCDQLLYSPFMTTLFFTGIAWESVKQKLWPTLLVNWMLWPAAHIVNFLYVPSDLRILYINVVNIFWTSYLSFTAATPITAKGGPSASAQDSVKPKQA